MRLTHQCKLFYEIVMIGAFSYSSRLNMFIFNYNRRDYYDMINNFQQRRRQRGRSFNKGKAKWGGGGGGFNTN